MGLEESLEIFEKLRSQLDDFKEMRENMGARAREVVDRFGLERVMNMWEKLILRCVHER